MQRNAKGIIVGPKTWCMLISIESSKLIALGTCCGRIHGVVKLSLCLFAANLI